MNLTETKKIYLDFSGRVPLRAIIQGSLQKSRNRELRCVVCLRLRYWAGWDTMRTTSLGLGKEDICEQGWKNCLRITSYGKRYQGEGGVLRSREETRVR